MDAAKNKSKSHSVCILCKQSESVYHFSRGDAQIVRCTGCDLLRREPRAAFNPKPPLGFESPTRTEELAAQHYIRCLHDLGLTGDKVIYSGLSEQDALSQLLTREGFSVTHHWQLPTQTSSEPEYDCVVLYQSLERVADPHQLLIEMRHHLKEDGHLLIVGSNLDSKPAQRFGRQWIGWKTELNHFFSRATLQLLLEKTGFHNIIQLPDRRHYSFEHASRRVAQLPDAPGQKFVQSLLTLVPKSLMNAELQLFSSAMITVARKTAIPEREKLSIIMPVFNEKRTFAESFAAINQRIIDGIDGIDDAEIIIVESNSTDGSRELVQSVQWEKVKVVLQDRPQGKGHAVRTGLKHATGTICVIQDADLEYDVYDYDALVKPLVEYRRTFVLGTRHAGEWKIRKFAGEAVAAFVLNFGHILFTTIINVFFGQDLTDPFTMYKVFRRECLYKLKFECNRFDFDHELLIKLTQKGYRPIEIPVNYNSRGFAEGKKIAVVRDPITWIIADVKYLFASPFEDGYEQIGASSKSRT